MKDVFSLIVPGKVRMYNCGPTVYSRQHIGNMRSSVFTDVLRRMFEYNNYDVKQVVNITDVDPVEAPESVYWVDPIHRAP